MRLIRRTLFLFFAGSWLIGFPVHGDTEEVPLHQRIDAVLEHAQIGASAELASDEDFVRRVYLNLLGRSPRAEETKSFLADSEANKRVQLIDDLMQSPEFARYYIGVLDVMFMERLGGTRVSQDEWRSFLTQAVEEQWSYDAIVQSIIEADGSGQQRGAAKFLLERDVEPNALTRAIGRIFLGRDLQCAQCHDHPNIVDYSQAEYHGILAFVSRSYLFEDPNDNKKAYVGEKSDGETEYKSVFIPEDEPTRSLPNLLSGLILELESNGVVEDSYLVTPSKNEAGVPKFSRRRQLARLITHPTNEYFAKNAVNRFWAQMMGRGIVDPVDFQHPDNLASQPRLLELLAEEFVNSGFDWRYLIREIALSKSYQRMIDFPALPVEVAAKAAEQQDNPQIAKGSSAWLAREEALAREQLKRARAKMRSLDASMKEIGDQITQLMKATGEKSTAIAAAEKQMREKEGQRAALQKATQAAEEAAKSLADDKSLAESHQQLKQRLAKLEEAVAAVKKDIESKREALKKENESLKSLRFQLARDRDQRRGYADTVAEARGVVSVFRRRARELRVREEQFSQQEEFLSVNQKLIAARQELAQAEQRVVEINRQRPEIDTQADAARDQLEKIGAGIVESQARIDELINQKSVLEEKQQKLEAAVAAIQAAHGHARAAAALFADAQLDDAIGKLAEQEQQLQDSLQRQVGKLKNENAELASNQSMMATLVSEQKKWAAKEESVLRLQGEVEVAAVTAMNNRDQAEVELKASEERIRKAWENRFAVRSLSPLSPEQLAGATIAALELNGRFEREAEQEWKKNQKEGEAEVKEEQKILEIQKLIDKRVDQVVSVYVSMFGAPGGAPQDVFSATADQALFFSNDGRVQNWLSPSQGTLVHRLSSIEDAKQVAEELHMAVLCRHPHESEVKAVEEYLQVRQDDRAQAVRELAWGLISSLEFRFNR